MIKNQYIGNHTSLRNPSVSLKVWPSGAVEVARDGVFLGEFKVSETADWNHIENMAAEVVANPTKGPKAIVFDSVECKRCDGKGFDAAWGRGESGRCYKCAGQKRTFTAEGLKAREFYDTTLSTTYGALKIGETFKFEGSNVLRYKDAEDAEFHNRKVVRKDWSSRQAAMTKTALYFPAGCTLEH